VRGGSRTTDNHEGSDPLALMDVALAVDCIVSLLSERCTKPLFAIDLRLTADERSAPGRSRRTLYLQEKMVGATGIEPVTPTMSR
jgi:hypothetical protein